MNTNYEDFFEEIIDDLYFLRKEENERGIKCITKNLVIGKCKL